MFHISLLVFVYLFSIALSQNNAAGGLNAAGGSNTAAGGQSSQQQNTCGAKADTPSCKQDFQDCDPSVYYSGLPTDTANWNRKELEQKITKTHRVSLPLDGVYEALMDVDHAPGGGIKLIYSNLTDTNMDYGKQDSWSREQLWPDTRGASGEAFNDIHNSRAEKTRVIMIRGDMLFGKCGTVEIGDVCQSPAFAAAPEDTEQDGKVWEPPATVRGDIARALFYMELRYKNTDSNLTLSDCGPFPGYPKMGILSQLLEWHMADEVSAEELERNNKTCANWQGNRNPFVDHPELVQRFFGQPQEIAPGTLTYPSCLDIPTPSPTAQADDCDALEPGDLFIYAVQSDDPDSVGFLALAPLPAGLEIYMTDYPWDGERFLDVVGEGVVKVCDLVICSGTCGGRSF